MASPEFALSRASVDDLTELTALMFESFNSEINELFTGFPGPLTTEEVEFNAKKLAKPMLEDPNDIWIVVRDNSSRKLVAGSHWRVFMNGASGNRESNSVPATLEGKKKEMSEKIIGSMFRARSEHMPGPFVYLHICFTSADYRRQGAGAMMLQWGCDLADQLFLPGWVEASKEGKALYEAFGFYDNGAAKEGGCFMTRPARSQPILGGKKKKALEEHTMSASQAPEALTVA